MLDEQEKIHIFPLDLIDLKTCERYTSHCTDGTGMCGCKPRVVQVCPEANNWGKCRTSCWKCGGSAMVAEYDSEIAVLVIHNDPEGSPVYPPKGNQKTSSR